MGILKSKKSRAKLFAGGVIKPEQVTTGVIEVETIASGAMVPISTGGGVISGGDTPPTPVVMYTFTISATPSDAVVTINGTITNSVTVNIGTVIDWSVEAEGYTPQSGSLTLTENKTLDVTLAEIVPEYTFTINPTPADAIVTINDVQQSSITAEAGTTITWSVSADGYTSQSGELTLTEDTTLDVVLEAASSWTYTGDSVADNVTVSAVPDSSIFNTSTRTPEEIYSGEYDLYFKNGKSPSSKYVSIKFPQPMNLKSISVIATNELWENSDYYNYIGLFKDGSVVTEIGYKDSKLNPTSNDTYTGAIDFNLVCDEIRLGNKVYNRSFKVYFKITDIQADYA